MPRQPYTRFQNRGNKKLSTPRGKFTMMKYYYVNMPTAVGVAPQPAAVLRINAASPFTPITAQSGTWTENDASTEPSGLASAPWTGYQKLVVLGCKVTAVVKDSIDNVASAGSNLHEGCVRLSRTALSTTITSASTNTALRDVPYSKGRAFQLAKTSVVGLPKDVQISQGYSAKRQMNSEPVGNYQLWVINTSGSANVPTNDTFINLSVHLLDEKMVSDTLKPFRVQLKIDYSIAFYDPNDSLNVPRPIPYTIPTLRAPPKPMRMKRYTTPTIATKANYLAGLLATMGAAGYARQGLGRYHRYRGQYNR